MYTQKKLNLLESVNRKNFTLEILRSSQKTFQRFSHVVNRLIWCRYVAKRQINVETTLCASTLKFTSLKNVDSMLSVSMLIWTTLDNAETTFSFSTSIFTTLRNVDTTLWIWKFEKNINLEANTKQYFWALKRKTI